MKPICPVNARKYLLNETKKPQIGWEVFEWDPKIRLFLATFEKNGGKWHILLI